MPLISCLIMQIDEGPAGVTSLCLVVLFEAFTSYTGTHKDLQVSKGVFTWTSEKMTTGRTTTKDTAHTAALTTLATRGCLHLVLRIG